jgi:hypothetical protein
LIDWFPKSARSTQNQDVLCSIAGGRYSTFERGFYRLVWHRALFDLAIYVIPVGVVTVTGASILTRA